MSPPQRRLASRPPVPGSYDPNSLGVDGPVDSVPQPLLGQPEQVVTTEQGQIFFAENEPQTFADFEGQEHIIEKLEMQLHGMPEGVRVLRPQLFRGIAGMGKTLIAKVTANEINLAAKAKGLVQGMWVEVFPESFDNLDAVVQIAQKYPGTTLFFDEIHGLDPSEALRLYELLANGRYQFRGCTQATLLPPTQIMGATTDYGSLHSALKRRFEAHDFRPATIEELEAILTRRTTLPAEPGVIPMIVSRTHFGGAPWEGLGLLKLATESARSRQGTTVTVADVERVFRLEDLDLQGLRPLDRRVLAALFTQPKLRSTKDGPLFVCYAASEQNVVMLAQLDKEEFRETVRPMLMSRQLLMLRPYYGQSLTDRAVERYGNLKAER
jgi:holliday junction DNA helicase RuvB